MKLLRKMLRRLSWLDRAALGVLVFDLLLLLLLGNRTLGLTGVLMFAAWIFLSLWVATTALVVWHRRRLREFWLWALLFGLCWLADTGARSLGPTNGTISAICSLVFFFAGWAIVLGGVILLFQYDVAIRVVGLLSLTLVWMAALMLFRERDIIGAILALIQQPNQRSLLWLFGWLSIAAMIILPLAALSFGWHTVVIIWREIRDASMTTAEYRRRAARQDAGQR